MAHHGDTEGTEGARRRCRPPPRGLRLEPLSKEIIGAAIEVHRALGPGLLERAYLRCLTHELGLRGLDVGAEISMDLNYKGLVVAGAYRLDLLVNDLVVVEVKAVDAVIPVHRAQLLTYLRLTGKPLGLLLNFKNELLRDGIERLAL